MKAIVQDRYGSPELLRLAEVDKPVPGDGQVLVRVKAAAVNARDWHLVRGDPFLARVAAPFLTLRAPKWKVRGSDFAGRVEAVGGGVSRFQPGDEVYADLREVDGAFAEYACVADSAVAHKPANLTFEQAAAVPLAGTTALMGLRDLGKLGPGQRVLINGASGGVGTFAVQIAKALGAHVTGVCSTRNMELVESLGADEVIDYTREDFTRARTRTRSGEGVGLGLGEGERYDVVFDLVANRSLSDLRRVLGPAGTLLLSGGGVSAAGRPRLVGPMWLGIKAGATSRFARPQRLIVMNEVPPSSDHLSALRELIEAGSVTPIVERTYPLAEVPSAISFLEVQHARAKVVISV